MDIDADTVIDTGVSISVAAGCISPGIDSIGDVVEAGEVSNEASGGSGLCSTSGLVTSCTFICG